MKFNLSMDSTVRGGKEIDLKNTVQAALKNKSCPTVKTVITLNRSGKETKEMPNDIIEYDFNKEIEKAETTERNL